MLLDTVMADYVLTPGSAYMSKGPLHQDAIDLEFYREMRAMLPQRWERTIRAAEGKRYEAMAHHHSRQGNLSEAREAAHQALCRPHPIDNLFSKVKASVAVGISGGLAKLRTKWKSLQYRP